MRAEELIKESELFANKDECYIHCEKVAGGVYNIILTGDPKTIIEGIFSILKQLSEMRGVAFGLMLRTLKRMNKRLKADGRELKHEDTSSHI